MADKKDFRDKREKKEATGTDSEPEHVGPEVPLNLTGISSTASKGKTGKQITLKNTLGQRIPTQLKDVNGAFYERYLERRERFQIYESEMTPILEQQVKAGIIKKYD